MKLTPLLLFFLTAATFAETRDPWLWPFSSDSIWNTSIGKGAHYVNEGFLPAPDSVAADPEYFYKVKAGDPERALREPGVWDNRAANGRELRKLRLPDDVLLDNARPGYTPNNVAAFLMPDGRTLEQIAPLVRPQPGGPVYGFPKPFAGGTDIRGPGIPGAHWGSGMSSLGGSLRHGELTGPAPIRHALKLEIWGKKFLHYDKTDATPGFRWPADMADNYASKTPAEGGYGGRIPKAEMGALLAIGPRHTEATLGLKTAPGKKLFHALQNYGGYLVDDAATDTPLICVESHAIGEFREVFGYDFDVQSGVTGPANDWLADLRALFSALSIVDNNAPDALGGGGPQSLPAPPELGDFDNAPPSEPGRGRVAKITPRSVALSWDSARDNVRVMAYEIFASGKLAAISFGRTNLEITGLVPGAAHSFTIRARDTSMNVSAFSPPLTVHTPPLPPGSYEDDFAGELANWKLEKAKGELGKLLLQNWQGDATAGLTGPTWSAPFTLRCEIEVIGEGAVNKAFIIFNHQDDRNTSWLEIGGKGANAVVQLHQTNNGETQKLAERRGWTGRTLEISRAASGALTIRAVDGAKSEILFDKIPASKPKAGALGFRTQFQQLSVNHLYVTTP